MSRADGSIIIDTKISDEGIKKGSKAFKTAVKNLANSVNGQIKELNKSFLKMGSGYNSKQLRNELKKEKNEIKNLQEQLKNLKQKYADIESGKVSVDMSETQNELKETERLIDTLRNKLTDLKNKRSDMISGVKPSIDPKTGVHTRTSEASKTDYLRGTSSDFNNLEAEITNTENKLRMAYGEAANFARAIENANNKNLSNVRSQIDGVENKLSESKMKADALQNELVQTEQAEGNLKGIVNELGLIGKTAGTASNLIKKGFSKISGTLKKAFSGIKRTVNMMFNMFVMRFAMELVKNLKESFNELVKFDSGLNSTISRATSKITQFKNQLVASFAPLIQLISPWIDLVLDKLIAMTDRLSMFFAKLSGKNTYTKAVYNLKDYAAGLEESEKNQKKLNKQVAQFDELNNMGENEGAGSSSAVGSSFATEEIPVDLEFSSSENRFLAFIDKIKGIFSKINFGPLKESFNQLLDTIFPEDSSEETIWDSLGVLFQWFIEDILPRLVVILSNAIPLVKQFIDWLNNTPEGQDLKEFIEDILDDIGNFLKYLKDHPAILSTILSIVTDLLPVIIMLFFILNNNPLGAIITLIITTIICIDKIGEAIGNIIGLVINLIRQKLPEWKEKITNFFNEVKKKATEKLTEMVTKAKNKIEEIVTKFNNMKTKATDAFDNIKKKFTDAFDGIKTKFENIIAWFKTKWDNFTSIFSFDSLGSIGDTISGWFGGTTDTKGGSGGTFSLRSTPIPECATGTVIPARFGKTPVIVGDNNKEAEVISPLSTIKQAVAEVLGAGANEETVALLKELVRLAKEGQNVNLTGDAAKFFKVQKKEELRWQKATGKA